MKPADIIRLGVIAIALIIAYQGIMATIAFIDYLLQLIFTHGEYKSENGIVYFFIKLVCLFGISWLLIRNSRKISNYIDRQN